MDALNSAIEFIVTNYCEAVTRKPGNQKMMVSQKVELPSHLFPIRKLFPLCKNTIEDSPFPTVKNKLFICYFPPTDAAHI